MEDFKKFLSDRTLLLLAFLGALLLLFNVFLVILQIDTTQVVAITRYNTIETELFTRGNVRSLYIFAVAPIIFYMIQVGLAVRVFENRRKLAILLLSMNIFILLFSVIVSSAIINVNK
jgi:hypothetical protein